MNSQWEPDVVFGTIASIVGIPFMVLVFLFILWCIFVPNPNRLKK